MASSAAFSLDVGIVNAGGGTTPVRVAHETLAYVADGADLSVSGGPLNFLAESTSHASAESFSLGIGVVGVVDVSAEATVEGAGQRAGQCGNNDEWIEPTLKIHHQQQINQHGGHHQPHAEARKARVHRLGLAA